MPIRGLDQRHNAKPQSATLAHDLVWDERDAWRSGPGYRQLVIKETRDDQLAAGISSSSVMSSPFDTMEEVTSIHWFSQHNGSIQWVVFETAAGDLKYVNGSLAPNGTSTFVKGLDWADYDGSSANHHRHVQTTPWARTQSVSFNNRLYLVNGVDEPLVFDGWKAGRAGFANPAPAPNPIVLDRTSKGTYGGVQGAGELSFASNYRGLGYKRPSTSDAAVSAYKYKVSFINERGQESPPSEASGIVQLDPTEAGHRLMAYVELPIGGDHVVARRVYRTQNLINTSGEPFVKGDAENFFYLTDIADNTSEIFVDYKPDVELGGVLVDTDYGPWPTGASLIATFKNTMFVAGTPSGRVHFSRPGFPEVFPEANTFDIGNKVSGATTGFVSTSNALIVFKTRGIFLIKGDPSSGFYAQTLTWDVGCSSPNSIVGVPGLGVAFLSTDGEVMILSGALENVGTQTRVMRLSTPIPDEVERINKAAIVNAYGAINRRDGEYWLAVPTIGNTRNNRILCYHFEVGQWSTKESFPVACMTETGDHRNYLLFGSWDTTNAPGIHVVGHGFGSKKGKQGTPGIEIQPAYRSATVEVQSVFNTFEISGIRVYALGYGRNKLRADVLINGYEVGVYQQAVTDDLEDYNEDEVRHSTDDETNHTYYDESYWNTWGSADSLWKSHHPVVVRLDMTTMAHEPIQELSLDFAPQGVRFQIIGWELLVRDAQKRDVTPLSSLFGQDLRR